MKLAPLICTALLFVAACSPPISNGVENPPPTAISISPSPDLDKLNPALYPALANYPELKSFKLTQVESNSDLLVLNLSPEISLDPHGIETYKNFLESLDGTKLLLTINGKIVEYNIAQRSKIHKVESSNLIVIPPSATTPNSNIEPHFIVVNSNRIQIDALIKIPRDLAVNSQSQQQFAVNLSTQLCRMFTVGGISMSSGLLRSDQELYSLAGELSQCASIGLAAGMRNSNKGQSGNDLYQDYVSRMAGLPALNIQGVRFDQYPIIPPAVFQRIPKESLFNLFQ